MNKRSKARGSLIAGVVLLGGLIAVFGAWRLMDPGFHGGSAQDSDGGVASQATDDAFGQQVRAYLLENPEVIMEAVARLKDRKRAAQVQAEESVLAEHADALFRAPDDPVGGNPHGDVTLVEFFDYNCPYCRRVAPVMAEAVDADPGLRIVYKEFPILGTGSVYAAKAALAARRQDRYAELHKALMQETGGVNAVAVDQVAERLGLNLGRLKTDMQDPEIAAAIERNRALARDLRLTGTPGFVIGDTILRGATDLKTLQNRIADARQAAE